MKKTSLAVTVNDKNIYDFTNQSVMTMLDDMNAWKLSSMQEKIGHEVIKEVRARLNFLKDVGLDYLALSRATGTLSGGEAQRIRLAT